MTPLLRLVGHGRALVSAAVIAGLIAVAMWPAAIAIDVAIVARGPLVVTIDEEGITRVRERFVVSAPVSGRVLRIDLEPGDRVTRGQVVARLRAEAPPLLDARARAEAAAAVESAQAALGQAGAEEQRAKATLAQKQRELARIRELAESRVVSAQELEASDMASRVAQGSAGGAPD
jgi:HlyD family secretion protein